MKKLLITEEEKKHIRDLHEQTWLKNFLNRFKRKKKGETNPDTPTEVETEKKDIETFKKLSSEGMKQEGDKYVTWGMGESKYSLPAAKSQALINAKSKFNKTNLSNITNEEEIEFMVDDNNIIFVKLSVPTK